MATPYFPLNPDYGKGLYRRSVRLTSRPNEAFGELEDLMHGMRCTIAHDGERITAVVPDFARVPMDTCPGAVAPLQELVGLPLATSRDWFYADGRPRRNCTHMYDLVCWTIAQAVRTNSGSRRYDIIVPDGDKTTATLHRDGALFLEWQIDSGVIVAPEPFAGRRILQGFATWAFANLSGDDLEAAFVLQMGYFVSGVRRVAVPVSGPIVNTEAAAKGACWTFSSPQFERAHRLNSRRDFTSPENLLLFR